MRDRLGYRQGVAAAMACAAVAAATGCGGSSTSLAAGDAARLHSDVAGIRSAAARRDPAAAHGAVRVLEADVTRLQTAGRLAVADATALLRDAARVDHGVSLAVQPPAPPTAPAPSGHGGGDKGHGNGDGGGDGGD